MSDFTNRSNFNKNVGINSIIFGADSPVLEVELNELQDILNNKSNSLTKLLLVNNCFVDFGTMEFSNGTFTISNAIAIVDGNVIEISSLSIDAINNDDIYLDVYKKEVNHLDTLKLLGNEQELNSVYNYILDDRINQETSRRMILAYNLSKTNTETNHLYLKIGSISSSNLIIEANEINILNSSHPSSTINSTDIDSWNNKWDYDENTIKSVKVDNAENADTIEGNTLAQIRSGSTKDDVGLGNVDNVQQAPLTHVGATGDAHGAATALVNGFMASADKTKLDTIDSSANNYSHPNDDGDKHVPANSTTNGGKVLKASATAGIYTWEDANDHTHSQYLPSNFQLISGNLAMVTFSISASSSRRVQILPIRIPASHNLVLKTATVSLDIFDNTGGTRLKIEMSPITWISSTNVNITTPNLIMFTNSHATNMTTKNLEISIDNQQASTLNIDEFDTMAWILSFAFEPI